MTTYDGLVDIGTAILADTGRLPERCLYGTKDFADWVQHELPELIPPDYDAGDGTPIEQVYQRFEQYASGADLTPYARVFKPLSRGPTRFVWELKTWSIRVFGWIPSRDVFVCAFGQLTYNLKNPELTGTYRYEAYTAMTAYARDQHGFGNNYIKSEKINDVISIPT